MSRVVAVIGLVLLLGGLALVARPDARAAVLATPSASARATTASPSAESAASTAPPSPTPLPPIPDGYRIQILRLGIDLPIREGDVERDTVQQRTPEDYAFHLPGTGIPGTGLNTYLYAHARRGMFLTLWNAAVGDEVVISTPDGRALRYIVAEVHPRVPPDAVSWTEPTAPERLTLQTSTGPNPSDPRFVVVARPG